MNSGSTKRKNDKFSQDTGPSSKRREIHTSLEKRMENCNGILEKYFEITMMPLLLNIGLLRMDNDESSSLRETSDEVIQSFAVHENNAMFANPLWKNFPNSQWLEKISVAIDADLKNGEKWEEILSQLVKFEGNMEIRKTTKYEMIPTEEHLIDDKLRIHFYIASNQFHKMLSKMTNAALPKKYVMNSCDAIESITYIHNDKMELEYAIQKAVFKMQGKLNPHGNVKELLIFHGTAYENIESIINSNFCIDSSPFQEGESQGRKKSMLFGRGIYFSEIPGVSLMYGSGLLLCKVIVGNCDLFKPKGEIPPDISDEFDSREVIKDGVGVVHVVKKSSQILPYCIIKLKKDSLIKMTKATTISMIPSQTMAYQQLIKKQLENKGVLQIKQDL